MPVVFTSSGPPVKWPAPSAAIVPPMPMRGPEPIQPFSTNANGPVILESANAVGSCRHSEPESTGPAADRGVNLGDGSPVGYPPIDPAERDGEVRGRRAQPQPDRPALVRPHGVGAGERGDPGDVLAEEVVGRPSRDDAARVGREAANDRDAVAARLVESLQQEGKLPVEAGGTRRTDPGQDRERYRPALRRVLDGRGGHRHRELGRDVRGRRVRREVQRGRGDRPTPARAHRPGQAPGHDHGGGVGDVRPDREGAPGRDAGGAAGRGQADADVAPSPAPVANPLAISAAAAATEPEHRCQHKNQRAHHERPPSRTSVRLPGARGNLRDRVSRGDLSGWTLRGMLPAHPIPGRRMPLQGDG